MNLRAIFFGTPQLSADILGYLLEQKDIAIVGIVSNPDTTGGRGHTVISSPVSQLAREKNIPLFQPEKVKDEQFLQEIKKFNPDIGIAVAYGKILPQALLDIPKYGILNVHTSLLPKYRGAAPTQSALLNGEKETGLTIMQMSLGMDEGDILLQEHWKIESTDTTGSLFEKTGKRGGPLLIETLQKMQDGTLQGIPQDVSKATYSTMIEKKDGELQFSWTTEETLHRWQAYTPWPGLYTNFGDTRVTLLEVQKVVSGAPFLKGDVNPLKKDGQGDLFKINPQSSPSSDSSFKKELLEQSLFLNARGMRINFTPSEGGRFGKIQWMVIEDLPAIQLADGYLLIQKIHPAGKKPMSGEEFARGYMKNINK